VALPGLLSLFGLIPTTTTLGKGLISRLPFRQPWPHQSQVEHIKADTFTFSLSLDNRSFGKHGLFFLRDAMEALGRVESCVTRGYTSFVYI
jgi:hypothetical protein